MPKTRKEADIICPREAHSLRPKADARTPSQLSTHKRSRPEKCAKPELRAFPVSTGPDSYQLDFGRGEWEGAV